MSPSPTRVRLGWLGCLATCLKALVDVTSRVGVRPRPDFHAFPELLSNCKKTKTNTASREVFLNTST